MGGVAQVDDLSGRAREAAARPVGPCAVEDAGDRVLLLAGQLGEELRVGLVGDGADADRALVGGQQDLPVGVRILLRVVVAPQVGRGYSNLRKRSAIPSTPKPRCS